MGRRVVELREEPEMPKENDLQGQQDQGGKHGGQAGMPKPEQAAPPMRKPRTQENKGEVVGDPPAAKPQRDRDELDFCDRVKQLFT
jgi:hypothetical protein